MWPLQDCGFASASACSRPGSRMRCVSSSSGTFFEKERESMRLKAAVADLLRCGIVEDEGFDVGKAVVDLSLLPRACSCKSTNIRSLSGELEEEEDSFSFSRSEWSFVLVLVLVVRKRFIFFLVLVTSCM